MPGFRVQTSGRGRLVAAFLMAASAVGITALILTNQNDTTPATPLPAMPPRVAAIEAPKPAFVPRYVGVSRALAIGEYAEGATAAEAEAAAHEKCEVRRLERFNRGNYTVASCERLMTLNNVLGPACGILFENNIVGNVAAVLVAAPNENQVQAEANALLRSGPAIFNNRDNPYASAMQICVEPSGRVRYRDIAYELVRG